jgi:fumarate reductase iron-sulfur subunit
MKINICNNSYTIEEKINNLLEVLVYIKSYKNNALAFKSGCRSGVCGSCAVRVNGIEKLSCRTNIKDADIVEPLKNSKVIKDLIVDNSMQVESIKKSHGYLHIESKKIPSKLDETKIDVQSNCILCNSCYSSCPVYEVNSKFIGPFALVRSYRYIEDINENDKETIVENIQNDGVFSCTLCGNCNMVCPAHIDIKGDIMKLQNKSVQFGHINPNFQMSEDFSFQGDQFGFNPNGF